MRMMVMAGLLMAAVPATAAPVAMPGPSYEVLAAGPGAGAYPTRADLVTIRYVGKLANGDIFSTSADEGRGITEFPVRGVVPGFSALVQMMRVGDKWRFHLPGYLAYAKPGRTHQPPEPTLKRDVPPNADLIFDVELVAIRKAPAT
ncbi:FKBP-type peptidyl-prolyl cis-trans isomerase [Sphingoaurantiacus capsulatus]|uniref:Peptidyl-prolyl cis-trans isomerase n=1 Tax=Sphingoaurantiacus capsulatus TaxID=1771310 RepID=A0ABV7XAX3_9SPHN